MGIVTWLIYLGKRRPESLETQHHYKETDHGIKNPPVAHKNKKGIEGHSMTGRKKK